jgi:DNA-binding protein HU-beta
MSSETEKEFDRMKTPMKAKLVRGKALKVKAAPARTAEVKTTTVTLTHLAKDMAETHQLPKKQTGTMLTDLATMIAKHLKKGARVRINGLGILQVRKRPARMGRNPATGERIKIKASKKVAFRAAKELKEAI